jgi:hypothetical protein
VEPAPTRATSADPSHPHATLPPTRDEDPDGHRDDHGRERSGLAPEWESTGSCALPFSSPALVADPHEHTFLCALDRSPSVSYTSTEKASFLLSVTARSPGP